MMTWLRLLLLVAMAAAILSGDASAQQKVPPEQTQFAASSRGEVYYWIGCDNWKRLSRANLRFFRSAEEAEEAGYRPSQARGCAPQLNTALITPRAGGHADCVVSRIIDGDTFQCEGGSRVRILIADADEVEQSIYADSAVHLLRRYMPVGTRVLLEFDVAGFDRYQRVLAYVRAGEVFINRELVRRGLARVAVYPPNISRVDEVRAAADSARMEGLGVWSSSAFDCKPADYRAGRCRR